MEQCFPGSVISRGAPHAPFERLVSVTNRPIKRGSRPMAVLGTVHSARHEDQISTGVLFVDRVTMSSAERGIFRADWLPRDASFQFFSAETAMGDWSMETPCPGVFSLAL